MHISDNQGKDRDLADRSLALQLLLLQLQTQYEPSNHAALQYILRNAMLCIWSRFFEMYDTTVKVKLVFDVRHQYN